jgi:hypothetical protein
MSLEFVKNKIVNIELLEKELFKYLLKQNYFNADEAEIIYDIDENFIQDIEKEAHTKEGTNYFKIHSEEVIDNINEFRDSICYIKDNYLEQLTVWENNIGGNTRYFSDKVLREQYYNDELMDQVHNKLIQENKGFELFKHQFICTAYEFYEQYQIDSKEKFDEEFNVMDLV